jgi:hypothetical protein
VERLQDLQEQFSKVSGGLLLRLERPSDVGQRLLGDRAKDGSNAAFEMEMDRGRAEAQRLGELAQAEPVRAGALDQLGGGGGGDRRFGQAGPGSGLPFSLTRERAMQRFRSTKTLQKFSSVHAQVPSMTAKSGVGIRSRPSICVIRASCKTLFSGNQNGIGCSTNTNTNRSANLAQFCKCLIRHGIRTPFSG